jgi:hypothetical protein
MSLEKPEKIRTLQRKLYCKAKAEPAYRFYLLYDKVCREDILLHAYKLARANAGAPGVDGITFAQIEAEGLEAWLASLREELDLKTYRPAPVRRMMIPKPGGGERPLGIPTIRDRVVQTAAKLVLEPIFEADFEDGAYGYRPGRSAAGAIKEVHRLICRGYTDVVDRGNVAPRPRGFEEDRLQQSGGMPCLSSSVAEYGRPSPGLASGKRGGARPDGRPPGSGEWRGRCATWDEQGCSREGRIQSHRS